MAIKNKILYDLITDPRLAAMTGAEAEKRDKALEAILAAKDAVELRKAVVLHGEFWAVLNPDIKPNPRSTWQANAPGFLGGVAPDAFFSDDTFLSSTVVDCPLSKIQLAAAEYRVKFGISAITDQDTLLQILSHNTEECRAYLATKVPTITATHGWKPSVKPALVGNVQPPDTNDSTNILPDAAIIRAKKQVANQFLTKVVNEARADKLQQLEDLITHKNDPVRLKAAMEALGIPVGPQLFDRLDLTLEAAVTARIKTLKDEAAVAKFKEELQKFEDGLKKPEDLLKETALLNTNMATFRDTVGGRFPPPPPDDYINRAKANGDVQTLVEDMHKRLCVKYVEERLKKGPDVPAPINVAHMAEVLKETTHGGIKNKIQTHNFIPEAEIRDLAIVDNPEQNRLFKAALVKRYVKELTGTPNKALLEKLAKPGTDIKEIRRELAAKIGNGITEGHLECLQDSDLKEIKDHARFEAFKLLVGEGNHSKLIDAFSSLPDKKQQELLNLKPENLRFILNAQTKEQLKHYLGKDVNGKDDYLAGIVTENKNNAFFKQIHNSEIAKILADYKPPITGMDDAKVKAINDFLLSKRTIDLAQNINEYRAVIDVLFRECGITNDVAGANKIAFYAAFNLDQHGTGFVTAVNNNTITDKIQVQHGYNRSLGKRLEEIRVASPPPDSVQSGYEKLLDVLLRVEKTAKLKPDDPSADFIREQLYESKTLADFLAKKINVPQVPQNIRDQLKEQLSSNNEFENLRKGLKADKAKSHLPADTARIKKDIEEAQNAYEKIYERNNALEERLDAVERVHDISTSQGKKKAPEFVGQSQEKLRNSHMAYKALQKECLDNLSYLEKAYNDLQALRPVIPEPLPPVRNPSRQQREEIKAREDLIEEAKQLDEDIRKELAELRKLFKKYQEIYKVTTKEILPALEKAYKGSERVTYQAYDVTISRRSREDALNMGHKYTDDNDPHFIAKPKPRNTGVTTNTDPTSLFQATEKPDPGEVICFDTKKPATIVVQGSRGTTTTENVDIEGRFTYDPSPQGGISGTMKGTDVTRAMPGRYEVVQSPRPTNDPDGKKKAQEITDEQVNFYMKMATQILSNVKLPLEKKIVLEGVRGKEDEVKYLYTSLLLVGEKMGLKPSDLKVIGDANFNPQAERKKTAGIDRGFSDTSFYNAKFKSRKDDGIVKGHIDRFNEQREQKKEQAKTTAKVSSSLQSTMKEEFSVGREIEKEAKERQKQEGISPEVARAIANNG
ncbi:hypothetical protein ACTAZI_10835 [Legionella bozemanae]|uniref:hypothetical protein n=1 Tax=Legionella bozemanae TaxID=447 RepID=UPI003EEB5C64